MRNLVAVHPAWLLLALLPLGTEAVAAAAANETTFYLQLVRGNNEDKPPAPEAKPVGPVLSKRLGAVFKWKGFWEIKRDAVVVKPGGSVRRRMSAEREIEIELLKTGEVEVRVYRNGTQTRALRQPLDGQMLIVGGDKGENQSWFIVVRRDEPKNN
jgi:hypothetical protein